MLESLKQFNGQLGEGATLSANISKLTPKEISRGINNFVQDKRLGIGRGFHKGKGWDSHGVVTCHSYGCGYNMGADLKAEIL
mmetsp:Transcript_56902/g.130270  ORF Transcript_56902/g.130270 Transcript_56902/m.130270 type:complete len:82 (+) Transcript_56902:27-272(+)